MRTGPQAEKFVHSALLFRFCLSVLRLRNPKGSAHDQEIGNILSYNASDTSHWKRGKKSVKSVHALEALSRHLAVDFETLHDLSDGSLDFEEAWFEFMEAENLKGLLLALSPEQQLQRREVGLQMESLAQGILKKADVNSLPVHVPELVASLPFIELAARDLSDRLARSCRVKPGRYSVQYRKGELRAHTRVAIAREIARILLHSERERCGLGARREEFLPFEVFDLSNALLVPPEALRSEMQKVPDRLNAVAVLADAFWVPKSVIRSRLASLVVRTVPDDVFLEKNYWLNRKVEATAETAAATDFSEEDGDDSSTAALPSDSTAQLS